MPHLRPARDHEIEALYRESHALWGAGLTFRAYVDFWADLRATTWGRRNFAHCVWSEDDAVLSSMKVYRPTVRLSGRTLSAVGFGAVFTPLRNRGRGHASAMLRHALTEAREGGDGLAILFTDIGTPYYAALGFQALPAEEGWGRLARGGRAPSGVDLRPMRLQDLGAVGEAHAAWCAARPLAFLRDAEQWEYLLARAAAFYRRFDGSDLARRYRVAFKDGRFAGYLVAVEGAGQWVVREVGAVNGSLDAMAEILQAGASEARLMGMRQLYGWFPPSFTAALAASWRLQVTPRRHAIPMVLRLDDARADLAVLRTAEGAFLPFLDQF